ncbi:MAG: CbtB-domain containing protein [Rhodobacter sp.]|nr:CbtB-domain containing protein [Rhodobacter sp.]
MTTQSQAKTLTRTDSGLASIAFALLAGFMLLTVSGLAQAGVLHDAAHDQRHAMAFPCH